MFQFCFKYRKRLIIFNDNYPFEEGLCRILFYFYEAIIFSCENINWKKGKYVNPVSNRITTLTWLVNMDSKCGFVEIKMVTKQINHQPKIQVEIKA